MLEQFQSSLVRLVNIRTSYEAVNGTAVVMHQVRWRKMRTNPKAKSKLDRVRREPTPIDPWEYNYLKTSYDRYRTCMKSVSDLFRQDLAGLQGQRAGISVDDLQELEREEHKRLMLYNEEENNKTRTIRESGEIEEQKENEEIKLRRIMQEEKERTQKMAELEELVRQEKNASKNFITLENMTEKISDAIDSTKNYNFRINKDGQIILPEDTAWTELLDKVGNLEQSN